MTKRARGSARPPTTLWIPSASLDRQLLDYTAIEDRLWDTRLLAWDVFGSLGHVESLRASKLLSPAEYRRIRTGLRAALTEVDDMVKHFVSIDGLPKPTQMLEALVTEHGGDINLRQRLARLYQQAGRKDDTIVQLDAIADLYHQSGNRAETIRTIQAIIALGPDNAAEYQELLQQIQSSA